uniref:activator-dependent family glycosyltransferase n=1 Tax=Herbidospora sakaeratensis TaxID=564415 RepID=UPI000782DF2E|nr:activator-dependent family glycosyltransferase [Herbidospora sakaeratensis]
MRVLLVTYQSTTIFTAMVPLAWALRTAGHDVRVASQPSFTGVITQAGLTAVPVGRNHTTWRVGELHPEQVEAERNGLPAPYDTVAGDAEPDWARMRDGYAEMLSRWHKLDNFPMIADLVDYARHWEPDLVIWEPTTYAGPIAARACGAAHARLLWSVDVFGAAREHYLRLAAGRPDDPLGEWLGGYARKYGFDFGEDLVTGQFTIDQVPGSLAVPTALDRVPMRTVPYGGPAVVPGWLHAPPELPRVALTLGTTATERYAGFAANVPDIIAALADLDLELVATLPANVQGTVGARPERTRLETFVPLHALAPTCAVVINHAGPGTFLTTALYGVPQVTLPWDFDEPELARRAAAQGGTLTLRPDRVTGEEVRDAMLRLIDEPGFADRAEDLRREMLAMPSPAELVPRLEELTAKHR